MPLHKLDISGFGYFNSVPFAWRTEDSNEYKVLSNPRYRDIGSRAEILGLRLRA